MLLLAWLGGFLTILSPCILPIVPLVFSRADRSFGRETIPMLIGLASVFALVASATTASASWAVQASEVGRFAAISILIVAALGLLIPRLAQLATRPFVRIGNRLDRVSHARGGILSNIVVGAAIGLLWAPCAGPILGLIIAGAALKGSSAASAELFIAFALGAATSLGLATFAGGTMLKRLRGYARADEWVRRGLGVMTLAGVFIIAAGWDRALFARGGVVETSGAEKHLIERLGSSVAPPENGKSLDEFVAERPTTLSDEGAAPDFKEGGPWINSPALTLASLRGKVVMVEFWTFECYNCLNALPHVKALEAKYRDRGLVVIGVHTPEFPREKVEANVREQVKSLGIVYPVVMDNGYRIWNSFSNQYWPAAYFIDRKGHIRYHHFGEGRYEEQDQVVRSLLDEKF